MAAARGAAAVARLLPSLLHLVAKPDKQSLIREFTSVHILSANRKVLTCFKKSCVASLQCTGRKKVPSSIFAYVSS